MKTIFTIFLIVVFTLSISAQNATSVQKNGSTQSGIAADNQTFSITKVYPNPVKDFANVELRSTEAGSLQINLINILGTEVKKWDSFYVTSGEQKIEIDLSFLKSGLYFLKITKSGKVVTHALKKL